MPTFSATPWSFVLLSVLSAGLVASALNRFLFQQSSANRISAVTLDLQRQQVVARTSQWYLDSKALRLVKLPNFDNPTAVGKSETRCASYRLVNSEGVVVGPDLTYFQLEVLADQLSALA